MVAFFRRLFGGAPTEPDLEIRRTTYQIEIRSADRAYVTRETCWRGRVPRLTTYRASLPVGAGRVARLQASQGRARLLGVSDGRAEYQIELPDPVAPATEQTQILSAILADPFPTARPRLTLHADYPTAALGLAIVFPLTRPPQNFAIRRLDDPATAVESTAPQFSPRADARHCHVWLKEAPPPGAVYEVSWTW